MAFNNYMMNRGQGGGISAGGYPGASTRMGSSNSAPALGGMSPELLALLMTQQQGIGGTGASIGAAPTGGTTGFIETAANPFGGASGVEFTSDGEIGGKGLLNMLKGIFM